MILFTIVKIGQLQMSVESREPVIHSGFSFKIFRYFRLTMKLHIKAFFLGSSFKKIPTDHDHITRDSYVRRMQAIKSPFNDKKMKILDHFLVFLSKYTVNLFDFD